MRFYDFTDFGRVVMTSDEILSYDDSEVCGVLLVQIRIETVASYHDTSCKKSLQRQSM